MQNISSQDEKLIDYTFENNEYNNTTTHETNFFNSPVYGSESTSAPSTHSVASTFQQTPQQNNTLLMCQKIASSIKELKTNAKKQLEQANELKYQLNQLKQSIIAQQQSLQSSIPRHVNRSRVSRVHRSHPYPLVSSHSPSIRPSVSTATYYHDESFSSHPQQTNVPGFPGDGNEILSANSDNITYN